VRSKEKKDSKVLHQSKSKGKKKNGQGYVGRGEKRNNQKTSHKKNHKSPTPPQTRTGLRGTYPAPRAERPVRREKDQQGGQRAREGLSFKQKKGT